MWLDSLLQDLRYVYRTLRRDVGFAAFAILIVALGIGASSTVFSVVNALLVRPLPFQDPARLAWVANHDVSGLSGQTTQVQYLIDLRARSRSLGEVAGYMAFYGVGDNLLSGDGAPERLSGVPVSENFFQVLGVQPQIGRLFTADECKWHGPKAVMLGHGLWSRRFAEDPAIVGRKLVINGEPYEVAGVLPSSFDFSAVFAPGSHMDLYFPFPLTPETNRWGNTMAMIARLKPGVTVGQAQAEMSVLGPQLTQEHRDMNTFEGKVRPLAEHVSGRLRLALTVLACAVGVVMMIVCANLSNLLLARTAARQKEIAIRTALGAERRRLIQQMLTESVALSGCGAVLGAILALGGTRLVSHLDAMNIPLLQNVETDWTALSFTLLAAVLTGIVFGLAPALQAAAGSVHDALKDSNRGSTGGRGHNWIRNSLVVSEIAFACVLLVGAGLLVRSFLRVMEVDLGFHPETAAAMRVDPDSRYKTQAEQNAYFDELLRRARAVPGMLSAGLTDALPLGKNRSWGAGEKGHTYPKGKFPIAFVRLVSDGYIGAMGIPLRLGRDFTQRDTAGATPVIAINETMARTLFPGESALGKIIRACGERQVVGVVGDVRHLALEEGSGLEIYLPMRQCQDWSSVDLVVRTGRSPAGLAAPMRAALLPIAPNLPGKDFRVLSALVDRAVSPRRFIVVSLTGFAAFALILASLGIYGVVSYSVNQRTQEIGIRMALGASATRLEAGIVGRMLGLASVGMLLGLAASWVLARALGGLLFGVTASDPATFAGMTVVLAAVVAIAAYVPARRASRIDPTVALRAS
jgi:predicted permease